MNDQQLENKVRQDVAKVRKDIGTLTGDSVVRLSRIGDNVSEATGKARKDITSWVEDGRSQLTDQFEKLTGEAKETVVDAATAVKKDVGQALSQYNAKAQEVTDNLPGEIGKKAARYPWVAISMALVVGFLLGILLKPAWKPLA